MEKPPSNPVRFTTSTAGATQSFDAADQLSTSTSGSNTTTYSYNSEGQRTATTPPSGPSTGFSYDQAGDLTGLSGPASASYTYNGDGLRVSKTVGTTTTDQVWDTSASVPRVIADGTTYYVYGAGGLPLEQISGTSTDYFLHDQLGSTRLLTDSTGSVVGGFTYNPYGDIAGSSGTVTTPLGFAGAYTDSESGLIYLVGRYYDPATGQFLSVDPLVKLTNQPYAYADDDPANAIDPNGLDCGLFSFACSAYDATAGGVKTAAQDTGSFVATHKVATGIALGVIGVATGGAGFLVEGAVAGTVLSAASVAAGGTAAYLDTGPCLQGDHAACAGAVLGWTAALAGVPSTIGLALGVSEESLSGSVLLGLLPGFAFNLGAGALTTDFGLWLGNELTASECPTK